MDYTDPEQVRTLVYGTVYLETVASIRDPEEPFTLEQLKMLTEEDVSVSFHPVPRLHIQWTPTNPNCTCAVNIGLCIKYKLQRDFPGMPFKVDVIVKEGSHSTGAESESLDSR